MEIGGFLSYLNLRNSPFYFFIIFPASLCCAAVFGGMAKCEDGQEKK